MFSHVCVILSMRGGGWWSEGVFDQRGCLVRRVGVWSKGWMVDPKGYPGN